MPTCSSHRRRLPPPISSREEAIAALNLATDYGRDDVVALACLDRGRRPLTMFIVEGCGGAAKHMVLAVGVLLDAVRDVASPLDAVIVGSGRPGGCAEATEDDRTAWTACRRRCAEGGIELLEWFVLADGATCGVGEQLGIRPEW